jgi:hypothetical protein
MYGELASWWPLLSPASEYEEEAAFYRAALEAACERGEARVHGAEDRGAKPRRGYWNLAAGVGTTPRI